MKRTASALALAACAHAAPAVPGPAAAVRAEVDRADAA